MSIKKYRLISEKEYERWKTSIDTNLSSSDDNKILESKLPDDLKIKLFQEQKRAECNTRDRAELALKMGIPLPVKKDVEIQYDQEQPILGERGTSPMPISDENKEEVPLKRKVPLSKRIKTSFDFQKASMKNIASYLTSLGIRGNSDGNVYINEKLVPESNFKDLIHQLSDARVKRTVATNVVINELKKHNVPHDIFSTRIMKDIATSNVNQSGDGRSLVNAWVSF